MKLHRPATFIILLSFILMGCHTQTAELTTTPTGTAIPTNTETLIPTSTFTPSPTSTEIPTATITPSPTPRCNADELLRDIQNNIQYEEFEVSYNTIQGTASLVIWYVENEINPFASGDEIEQNALLAFRSAAMISHQLAKRNTCIERLFTVINPIVVDENYNGWFSGQVKPNLLPASENLSENELVAIENSYEIGYFRTNPTLPLSPGLSNSCTWRETRENIQQHFSPERENVSFYFVIDDAGINVWANWDGSADLLVMASILNVAMELDCLYPSPTQLIMIIVDGNGQAVLIGILPSDGIINLDLNQLQILYQK